MPIVIVVNTKPNITHLPYTLKKRQGLQSFYPGNNQVDREILDAVMEQAGEEAWQNYYAKFLKPVGKPVEAAGAIDLADLNASDFIDLIEGQMDLDELEKYRQFEVTNDQRKTVLRAIDRQTEELSAIVAGK